MGVRKLLLIIAFVGVTTFVGQMWSAKTAFAQSTANEKLLGVVITATGNTIKVKGYCIYVKNGVEIRKELEKDNAWGWSFRGDYIKEVDMQKISGDASYQLFVMEGNDTVFESEPTDSTKPIVYKRPLSQ